MTTVSLTPPLAARVASDAPARVPVKPLAAVTFLACVFALILAEFVTAPEGTTRAPDAVVIGQALWNAAQVGLLLLLLCLWVTHRRWWVAALTALALAWLPFAIYVTSPGAWALTVLVALTCAAAWPRPDFSVTLVDAPARGTPLLSKFEFFALIATLLCSIYNFHWSKGVPPYWDAIFKAISSVTGFKADLQTIAHVMYTLGIEGVSLPSYLRAGIPANNLGSIAFALIWTVLPALYVLYFAALFKTAKGTPGARIQQALCLIFIVHFLFLTDLVDYRLGRGIGTEESRHWAHWLEIFAWRFAILIPVWQKFFSGQWKHGNGRLGVLAHYGIAAWAVGWFVYDVLTYSFVRFFQFATGQPDDPPKYFGLGHPDVLGWHGALVVMILVYGYMAFAMRCKRVAISSPA